MLSYIPEPTLPHPRVKAVRQVAEDLMESSESQEESGSSTPKPRKYKVTSLLLLIIQISYTVRILIF